jgi:hypothetical protein
MHPVWKAKKDQSQIEIAQNDMLAYQEGEFPLAQHTVWDIVTDPEYRALFVQSIRQQILNRKGGRLAPGSVYQCFHGGKRVTTQTILEWLPFEQMTTEDTTPVPGATCLVNIRLSPTDRGTRLAFTCSKARGPWLSRLICNFIGGFIISNTFRNGMRDLETRLKKDLAEGKYSLQEGQIRQKAAASLNEV